MEEPTNRKVATRRSWKNLQPLPAARAPLAIHSEFSGQEYERISCGLIPQEMEDKWFIFMEEGTLYFHRSWTGYCIYQLRLVSRGNSYVVADAWASRDREQYRWTDDSYDERQLLSLIDNMLLNRS
jgi:hypothetical protein